MNAVQLPLMTIIVFVFKFYHTHHILFVVLHIIVNTKTPFLLIEFNLGGC